MTTERKNKFDMGWNWDHSYTRLPKLFYSMVEPTPVRAPELVILNHSLAQALGLNPQALENEEGTAVLAGNRVPEGGITIAQAYAGHQFGYFTMLGDGRALLLGEQITPSGQRFDIQLKGSGRTPYSRGGDGRAALGPMLREYIISEAMYALGIPTTRSLAVVTTGERVIRETELPGAVLTRVAASYIRVGTFEYAAQWGAADDLRALADYTIERHFPQALAGDNPYLSLLKEVIKRQAGLIAQWQLVGFIHGVMNTDNMVLSGETIDYGPCAFMDIYDPATVFSSIDTQGRYAYGNQPGIAAWNLARFAETLLPMLHEDRGQAVEMAQEQISGFFDLFRCNWLKGMRAKLGIVNEESGDEVLIKDLLGLMQKNRADFTNTFRSLTEEKANDNGLFASSEFIKWQQRWQERRQRQDVTLADSAHLMRQSNSAVIPRNHRVEEALDAAVKEGDYSVMNRLLQVLAHPYQEVNPDDARYTEPSLSDIPYRTFCGT